MIPAVDGLLVIAAGFLALLGATGILRTFGPGFRVGRLLSSAPDVSIREANEIAASGAARYLRITGRIDSETDFTDADNRPLVFRRGVSFGRKTPFGHSRRPAKEAGERSVSLQGETWQSS